MKEYHKIQTVFKRDPATKHKTLLEGVYSLPEFEYLKDNRWLFTEKVDGTNIRVMFDGERVSFGGKTDNAQIPAKLVDVLIAMFPADLLARAFDGPACLYGEGYGARIQKGGGNYRPDQSFVLFDVKVGEWWLQRDDALDVSQKLEIDVVPLLGPGTLLDMVSLAKRGFGSKWGDFPAEGIVARPDVEMCTRQGKRLITKIKCKDFVQR